MSTPSTPTPSKRKCPNYDPKTREPNRPGGSCPQYSIGKCPLAHPWQSEWDADSNNGNPASSLSYFNIAPRAERSGLASESSSAPPSRSSLQSPTHPEGLTRPNRSISNASTNKIDRMVIDLEPDEDVQARSNQTSDLNIPSKSSGSSVQLISGPEPVLSHERRVTSGSSQTTQTIRTNGVSGMPRTSRASRATHASRPSNASRSSYACHASAASAPDSSAATFITARSVNSELSKASTTSIASVDNSNPTAHPIANETMYPTAQADAEMHPAVDTAPPIEAMDTTETIAHFNPPNLTDNSSVRALDDSRPLETIQESLAVELFLKRLILSLHRSNRFHEIQASLTSYKDLWRSYDTRQFDSNKLQLKDVLAAETRSAWIAGKDMLVQQAGDAAASTREWIRDIIEVTETAAPELGNNGTGGIEASKLVQPLQNLDVGGDSTMKDVRISGGTTPRPSAKSIEDLASELPQRQQTEEQAWVGEMAEALRRWRGRLRRGAIGDRLGALRLELEDVMRFNRIPPPGGSLPPRPFPPIASKISTASENVNQTTRVSNVTSTSGLSSADEMGSDSLPDERDELDELEEDIDIEMSDLSTWLSPYERSLLGRLHNKVNAISEGLDAIEEWARLPDDDFDEQLWETVDRVLQIYIAEKIVETNAEKGSQSSQNLELPDSTPLALKDASGGQGVVPKVTEGEALRELARRMVEAQSGFRETRDSAEYFLGFNNAPAEYDFDTVKAQLMKVQDGPESTRLRAEELRLSQMLQAIETRHAQTPPTSISSTQSINVEMSKIFATTFNTQSQWIQQSQELQAVDRLPPIVQPTDIKLFKEFSDTISSVPEVGHREWLRTFEQLKQEAMEFIEPIAERTEQQKERLKRDKEQYLGQTPRQSHSQDLHHNQNHQGPGYGHASGVGHNAVGSHS